MRNITVISKLILKPDCIGKFDTWFVEWQKFINNAAQCKSLEILLKTDESIIWFEYWNSEQQHEKFVREHLLYSDLIIRLVELCYDYERETYKRLQ